MGLPDNFSIVFSILAVKRGIFNFGFDFGFCYSFGFCFGFNNIDTDCDFVDINLILVGVSHKIFNAINIFFIFVLCM